MGKQADERPPDTLPWSLQPHGWQRGKRAITPGRLENHRCLVRGTQIPTKSNEKIGRQNLKYYSPRSESDRGGLVLKI